MLEEDNLSVWIDVTPEHNELEAQLDALGVSVIRTPLETGDVWWTASANRLAMAELKRIEEALGSFSTGRMLNQMFRVHEISDIPMLILSGYLVPSPSGWCRVQPKTLDKWNDERDVIRVRYDAFNNYLAGLMAEGIIVDRLISRKELPRRLISLIRWTLKEEHKSLRPSLTRPTAITRERYLKLSKLMSTTGIGEELAKRLLSVYGDSPWEVLRDILNGDANKALSVTGMGAKRLEQFRKEWL